MLYIIFKNKIFSIQYIVIYYPVGDFEPVEIDICLFYLFHFFFPGYVTDEDVKQRESKLRDYLRSDLQFCVKQNASVEVSQV